jgi:hypothetical protein
LKCKNQHCIVDIGKMMPTISCTNKDGIRCFTRRDSTTTLSDTWVSIVKRRHCKATYYLMPWTITSICGERRRSQLGCPARNKGRAYHGIGLLTSLPNLAEGAGAPPMTQDGSFPVGAGIRGYIPAKNRGWGANSPHGDTLAGTR